MGIETTLDGRQDKEYCELPKETNHSRSKKSRRRQKKSATVQNLFQTCKEVFASGATGFIPPPADVERLRLVLGMPVFLLASLSCLILPFVGIDFNLNYNCAIFKLLSGSCRNLMVLI